MPTCNKLGQWGIDCLSPKVCTVVTPADGLNMAFTTRVTSNRIDTNISVAETSISTSTIADTGKTISLLP